MYITVPSDPRDLDLNTLEPLGTSPPPPKGIVPFLRLLMPRASFAGSHRAPSTPAVSEGSGQVELELSM